MPYVLAIIAAVGFGSSDFLGGLSSRKASSIATLLTFQASGFLVLLPILAVQAPSVDRAGILWAGGGGLIGSIGMLIFLRALASGAMAVAAPVVGVSAASLQVLVGVALGERPSPLAWVGVGAGLVAIVATGWPVSEAGGRAAARGAVLALAAGACFGLFYVGLSRAAHAGGVTPLLASRMAAVAVSALVVLLSRSAWTVEPGSLRPAVVSGVLDVSSDVLVLIAFGSGALSLVSVLVALYPAMTVALALAILRERLRPLQWAGIALAIAAAALIATS
ncbi:MAG TPA: EamA family transporter [Candidatus Dormibacteraeota bacterium]|nr:EamA family transporter [Candidatus Dormibacteraeota bacterium]